MLEKEKQYEYIEKRCENLLTCVNDFSTNADHEEMHKLRVEIKKLRAYAGFVSRLRKKDVKRKLEPIKEIFRKAGEVRTAQLNLETIKKYKIRSTGFKKSQQAVGENVSKQFVASAQRYATIIEDVCQSLKSDCRKIRNKEIRRFFSEKIEALSLFFSQDFDEKKLHARRKIIKVLLYMENLLPEKLREELALNISYFDALQETAGKWHDALVTIDLLAHNPGTNKESLDLLIRDKDGLFQAVKLLATHFDKNLSIKKRLYTGP